MAFDTWILYLLAAIGLSLAPGPNSLLALTHGALYGHKRALSTIAGGITGFIIIIALSMFGIGALLRASSEALTLLRWAGGAYLIWLGVQIWRSPPPQLEPVAGERETPARVLARQGFLAALSNPKVLLFFGAFLPQFLDPGRDLLPQFVIMALTFALAECLVEYTLAFTAHHVRPWLERSGRAFNRACGGVFAAIGVTLPLGGG